MKKLSIKKLALILIDRKNGTISTSKKGSMNSNQIVFIKYLENKITYNIYQIKWNQLIILQ